MVIELEEQYKKLKDEVYDSVKAIANKYKIDVADTVLYNLAIHLSLSITREETGNYISTSQSQLEGCKSLKTYDAAKEIIQLLNEKYHIELPESDTFYTAMYLANKSLLDLDFDASFDIVDDEIADIMDETLDEIKTKLGYDLRNNENFVKGMSLHFYPAIERLENNEQLKSNPMTKEISSYEEPLKCANILNDVVSKHFNKTFNDNELSYITLHFGTAFYRA